MSTKDGKYWDKAWSLVDGCTKCSPGCLHCWLEDMGKRFHKWPEKVTVREDRLDIPLRTRKPTVFSVWSDLFHEDVPDKFIERAFSVMHQKGNHIFLALTKRASRMAEWYAIPCSKRSYTIAPSLQGKMSGFQVDNLWTGLTVCNQEEADAKIPTFLTVPGKKWLSLEPLLGPVDLYPCLKCPIYPHWKDCGCDDPCDNCMGRHGVDWVVVGPETGTKRRECDPAWIRSVVDQCRAAGVPAWVKAVDLGKKVSHDMTEWPEDLRVREPPWSNTLTLQRNVR